MEKNELSNLIEVEIDHIVDLNVNLFDAFLFETFAFFATVIGELAFDDPG
jgi:hypothetical protein